MTTVAAKDSFLYWEGNPHDPFHVAMAYLAREYAVPCDIALTAKYDYNWYQPPVTVVRSLRMRDSE